MYTEANYTEPMTDALSLALHVGYSWGDYWDTLEPVYDYAVQLNWTAGHFTVFGKITGTDASGPFKVEGDIGNNEARALIGVMTTFPWSK
jgi:hypothetical protein